MSFNHTRSTAVIVDGFRTPFVKSDTVFKDMSALDLGAWTVRELLERTEIARSQVEGVIVGNTMNCVEETQFAHILSTKAGVCSPSFTVQNKDLSSLESVIISSLKVQTKQADVFIAGGVENMSRTPLFLDFQLTKKIKNIIQSTKWKDKFKEIGMLKLSDFKLHFAENKKLLEPIVGWSKTTDQLLKLFPTSEKEQKDFTLKSVEKARVAQQKGIGKEEIIPVFPPPEFKIVGDCVPYLAKEFLSEGNFRFRATDGAAFLLIMSEEKAKALGYRPLVKIHSYTQTAIPFCEQGLGPVIATEKLLRSSGLKIQDLDLWEIDELFPLQALCCFKAFGYKAWTEKYFGQALGEIPSEKYNVNGSALALGHPLSAGGARLLLSLAKEMKRKQVKWGMASAGVCGRQASALLLENI